MEQPNTNSNSISHDLTQPVSTELNNRQYIKISDEKRHTLICKYNNEGKTIKKAAESLRIPYKNAVKICNTFNRENRINKISPDHTKDPLLTEPILEIIEGYISENNQIRLHEL